MWPAYLIALSALLAIQGTKAIPVLIEEPETDKPENHSWPWDKNWQVYVISYQKGDGEKRNETFYNTLGASGVPFTSLQNYIDPLQTDFGPYTNDFLHNTGTGVRIPILIGGRTLGQLPDVEKAGIVLRRLPHDHFWNLDTHHYTEGNEWNVEETIQQPVSSLYNWDDMLEKLRESYSAGWRPAARQTWHSQEALDDNGNLAFHLPGMSLRAEPKPGLWDWFSQYQPAQEEEPDLHAMDEDVTASMPGYFPKDVVTKSPNSNRKASLQGVEDSLPLQSVDDKPQLQVTNDKLQLDNASANLQKRTDTVNDAQTRDRFAGPVYENYPRWSDPDWGAKQAANSRAYQEDGPSYQSQPQFVYSNTRVDEYQEFRKRQDVRDKENADLRARQRAADTIKWDKIKEERTQAARKVDEENFTKGSGSKSV